jgi:hypothetical protein
MIFVNLIYGQKVSFTNEMTIELYDKMIQEIEDLDAEAIEVTNKTKAVNLESYKAYHKKRFLSVKNNQALKERFLEFGKGFVSGHSYFEFLLSTNEKPITKLKSNIKIGYTYPNVSFFDLDSKKTSPGRFLSSFRKLCYSTHSC